MNAVIRDTIMSVPGLALIYSRARKRYHAMKTQTAAKRYFLNYDVYRDALWSRDGGTVDLRTADGLTISVRRNEWDARILLEIFLYQPYTLGLELPPSSTVVDIGGYIGDFALFAVARLRAERVVVYEPSPKNYALLLRNIRNNAYEDHIVPVCGAVGNGDVLLMDLDLPDHQQVNVSAYRPGPARIQSVTLGDVMRTHQLDTIDLLKIDCEGGEYAILLETPEELFAKIKNIAFEYHRIPGFPPMLQAVRARLRHCGYSLAEHSGDIIWARRAAAEAR